MTRNTLIGMLAARAAAAIGSSWQLASRHGVTTTLGPLELAVLRYGVPAVVLLPLTWRGGMMPEGLSKSRIALLVLGGGLPFGLVVLAGAQWAPAAHIGIFMAGSVPLFTALGAWLVDRDKVTGLRLAGLLLIAGGMLMFANVWRGHRRWRGGRLAWRFAFHPGGSVVGYSHAGVSPQRLERVARCFAR